MGLKIIKKTFINYYNMNLKKKKVNLTEIITLLLDPRMIVEEQYFPSVLHENTEIQAEYGADNKETFEHEYHGWSISFRPDQVEDDKIIEVKVRRPYSKVADLRAWAYLQGLLQAYMLGKPKFVIVIISYNPSAGSKKIELEQEFDVSVDEARNYLDISVGRLEAIRDILKPVFGKDYFDILFENKK